MFPTSVKTFVHPHTVYRLEYPSHWDAVVQKEGESCGFGPHDRDDVGLWISIMPVSADTEKMQEDLPKLMLQSLQEADVEHLRRDPSLHDYGLVADMTKEGEGGHYWMVAGGDVVLFASSDVPVAERDTWNPFFLKLMASLKITRDEQLFSRKVANELLGKLRERYPEQDFAYDADKIRGRDQVVYLSNILREVKESPNRREEIIKRFVDSLSNPATAGFGHEVWDEIRLSVLPVLKPRDYIHTEGPTQHIYVTEWLADVIICYAIKSKNLFRFITGWDLNRWSLSAEVLHAQAVDNLTRLSWPKQLMGGRSKDSGRVIVVDTEDSLASSRLLHPELHTLFSKALGSPFWAGIPDRNTLVLYSNRRDLKQRIARRLQKDYNASAYAITAKPFLVTRDGVAPSSDK